MLSTACLPVGLHVLTLRYQLASASHVVSCPRLSHVPGCRMSQVVSCPRLSHVPCCLMSQLVSCPMLSHVPGCLMSQVVSCPRLSHVPGCLMSQVVSCPMLSHVPGCLMSQVVLVVPPMCLSCVSIDRTNINLAIFKLFEILYLVYLFKMYFMDGKNLYYIQYESCQFANTLFSDSVCSTVVIHVKCPHKMAFHFNTLSIAGCAPCRNRTNNSFCDVLYPK